MAAETPVPNPPNVDLVGNVTRFLGQAGTADASTVLVTPDVSRFDQFMFRSSAGAMAVYASLDDTNFDGPIALDDMGAVTGLPVVVTAASRLYRLRGCYRALKLQQSGGTNVTGAVILAGKVGLGF